MKIYTLFIFCLYGHVFSQQNQVGINTSNPDPSAILHIESFTGIEATATATISGNAVNGVSIVSSGSGYTSQPTINFVGGGAITNGGRKAKATAVLSGGQITGITINDGGSGYTIAPTIVISGGNKGILLPNLNIVNVNDISSPVLSPANGLVAYNGGNNTNRKAVHVFNGTVNQWQSAVSVEDTPRIAYVNFTGNLALLDNTGAGGNELLLRNPLLIAPVSNINGFKIIQNNLSGQNNYSLVLPQGNYLIEVNLNLNAPPANPSTQATTLGSSQYYSMGYFIDFWDDTYNNATGVFTYASTLKRKETPLISKTNSNHLATWSYYYSVPSNANANIIGALRLNLGRMQGTSFYDLVNVISAESYIRISKL